MRPKEDIEQSLRNSDLDIEIHTEADRAILSQIVSAQRTVDKHIGMKFAIAAVVMMAALLVVHLAWHSEKPARVDVPKEPAIETLNLASLNAAYRRGGLDAVDAQYQKVFSPEPKPQPLSVTTLLGELTNNGES